MIAGGESGVGAGAHQVSSTGNCGGSGVGAAAAQTSLLWVP